VTIYKGDAWPAAGHDWAIVADVGGNLVHRKRLDEEALEMKALRVDERSELVSSSDIWFRPVQFANGPDGALYIADMYREVIEHPGSLHPVIKKHLDLTSGRDRGRIYRIVGDDFEQPAPPRLGAASSRELADALDTKNGWRRETAARLLYERQDKSVAARLEELAAGARHPEGRVAALAALAGIGELSAEALLPALADDHPRVQAAALRISEAILDQSPQVREQVLRLAESSDLRVRYQAAFTLGEMKDDRRFKALATIAKRDAADRWIRLAVQSSLAEGAGAVLAELAADTEFRSRPEGLEFVSSLAAQIGRQQRPDDVAGVLTTLQGLPASDQAVLQAIVAGLDAKPDSELARQVAEATSGRSEAAIAEMVASAKGVAANGEAPVEQRAQAVRTLRMGRFDDLASDVLGALLAPAQPAEVQAATIATLGAFDEPAVADLLLSRFREFTPALRMRAGDVLFSRPSHLSRLLDALEAGDISPGDLEPGRLKMLSAHPDAAIGSRAQKLLAQTSGAAREKVVADYRPALETTGDAERGKLAFKKTCAACHKLDGVGHEIGPNLAAMRNRGPETILLNVLDPNREVNPQYLTYTIFTTDGRSFSGMIAAETATAITLKRADNASDTILRIDIEEIRSTGLSLMPEGMEKDVDKQTLADLIAYLMGQ
jgi:putative heme-binding domain-containing protein